MALLQDLTQAELLAKAEAMQAQIAALKASRNSKLTLKVSKAGAVSVYGMGKWPVTLYQSQWLRLLAPEAVTAILAFIEGNQDALATKD